MWYSGNNVVQEKKKGLRSSTRAQESVAEMALFSPVRALNCLECLILAYFVSCSTFGFHMRIWSGCQVRRPLCFCSWLVSGFAFKTLNNAEMAEFQIFFCVAAKPLSSAASGGQWKYQTVFGEVNFDWIAERPVWHAVFFLQNLSRALDPSKQEKVTEQSIVSVFHS